MQLDSADIRVIKHLAWAALMVCALLFLFPFWA